jgi:hypothetical protein
MKAWLGRLRHDLVKPLVWPARDLLDLGRPLQPTDLAELERSLTRLIDQAGTPVTLTALWHQLRAAAPATLPAAALDRFELALLQVEPACRTDVPAAVRALIGLEQALAELIRSALGGAP